MDRERPGRFTRACFLAVGAIALAVMLYWLPGFTELNLPARSANPMSFSAALLFLATAAWSLRTGAQPRMFVDQVLTVAFGTLVATVSLVTLLDPGFGYRWQPYGDAMSPITAGVFLLVSAGAFSTVGRLGPFFRHQVQATVGLLVLFAGVCGLLSLALNVPVVRGNQMPSLPSVIAFVILGVGTTAGAGREAWPALALLASGPAAARRARTGATVALITFVLLAAGSLVMLLARAADRQARETALQLVATVADFKANHVTVWFSEREADATVVRDNGLVADELVRYFQRPSDVVLEATVDRWMGALVKELGYANALLTDHSGRLRRVVPHDSAVTLKANGSQAVAAALASRQIQFLDMAPFGDPEAQFLTWVIPIGSGDPVGTLTLTMDPDRDLWKAVDVSSESRPSTEAYLVRRDGDHVSFLNRPGLWKGVSAKVPMSLSPTLPAVRAALGEEGGVEADDHRGVPVIAAVRQVPATRWALVVKVDRVEALAPARELMWMAGVAVGASTVVGILVLGHLWHRREVKTSQSIAKLSRRQQDSAERLRTLLRSAPDAHLVVGVDGIVREWNQQAERTFGWREDEAVGRPLAELVVPTSSPVSDPRGFARFLAAGGSGIVGRRVTVTARHRDGHQFPVELAVSQVQADGELMFSGFIRDLSKQAKADALVRTLTTAVEQSPVSIVITDPDGTITYVNPAFTSATGYASSEAIGQNPRILKSGTFGPEDYRRLWETLAAGRVWEGEFHNKRKDGALFWERATISPLTDATGQGIGYVAVKQDITEEKRAAQEHQRLQSQFAQAQKMESVGRLAGGVAHDFNNMLAVILGNAELALDTTPEIDPRHEHLVEILQAALRSSDLTRQLLAFARKQVVCPKRIDLNQEVGNTLKMLGRLIGENIALTWEPDLDLWPVLVDPMQVDQVLANLAVNARDAIAGVGAISIATRNVTISEQDARSSPRLRAGEFAQLSITDTGCGMPPDILAHLFEPFFTTKEEGKGTGLGTATVYGIVTQNNGLVDVESTVGVGTTMRVLLPRVGAEALAADAPDPADVPDGHETILLVEDEIATLEITRRMLERLGYTVQAHRSGAAALSALDRITGPVHLVLTDVVMPGMNGRSMADAVTLRYPDVRILYMSGYTSDVLVREGVRLEGTHFLPKPFTTSALALKIRGVLDQ